MDVVVIPKRTHIGLHQRRVGPGGHRRANYMGPTVVRVTLYCSHVASHWRREAHDHDPPLARIGAFEGVFPDEMIARERPATDVSVRNCYARKYRIVFNVSAGRAVRDWEGSRTEMSLNRTREQHNFIVIVNSAQRAKTATA